MTPVRIWVSQLGARSKWLRTHSWSRSTRRGERRTFNRWTRRLIGKSSWKTGRTAIRSSIIDHYLSNSARNLSSTDRFWIGRVQCRVNRKDRHVRRTGRRSWCRILRWGDRSSAGRSWRRYPWDISGLNRPCIWFVSTRRRTRRWQYRQLWSRTGRLFRLLTCRLHRLLSSRRIRSRRIRSVVRSDKSNWPRNRADRQ